MSRVITPNEGVDPDASGGHSDHVDIEALKACFFSSLHDVRGYGQAATEIEPVTGFSVPLPRGAPIPPLPTVALTPALAAAAMNEAAEIVLVAFDDGQDHDDTATTATGFGHSQPFQTRTHAATFDGGPTETIAAIAASPLRRGIHRVASASAALAVAVITAGIGNAVFDTYNAVASGAGTLHAGNLSGHASTTTTWPSTAPARRQASQTDSAHPANRLAFVRTAAFEASLASLPLHIASIGVAPALPRPIENRFATRTLPLADIAPVFTSLRAEPAAIAVETEPRTTSEAAPAIALDVPSAPPSPVATSRAAKIATDAAPAVARPLERQAALATPGPTLTQTDASMSVVASPPPLRIVNSAPPIARAEIAEPARPAPTSDRAEASFDPTAWQTEVKPTLHGRRQIAAPSTERGRDLRRQAYGLGANGFGKDRKLGDTASPAEVVAPAPQSVSNPMPWYLKRPDWSPFEGSAAYRR